MTHIPASGRIFSHFSCGAASAVATFVITQGNLDIALALIAGAAGFWVMTKLLG